MQQTQLKYRALAQARARLANPGLEPSDGKVIVDLLTTTVQPPEFSEALLLEVLKRFPDYLPTVRAVVQCIKQRVRSEIVFNTVLEQSLKLLEPLNHEELLLVKDLTRASRHARPKDRIMWLEEIIKFIKKGQTPQIRGILLQCSAEIADVNQFGTLLDLIGPENGDEVSSLHAARQIIARKQKT